MSEQPTNGQRAFLVLLKSTSTHSFAAADLQRASEQLEKTRHWCAEHVKSGRADRIYGAEPNFSGIIGVAIVNAASLEEVSNHLTAYPFASSKIESGSSGWMCEVIPLVDVDHHLQEAVKSLSSQK